MSVYKLMSYAVVAAVFGASAINADAKIFGIGKSSEKQVENTKEKKGIFSRLKEKHKRKSEFKKTDADESFIKSFKEQAKLLVINSKDEKSVDFLNAVRQKLKNIQEMRPHILGEAEDKKFSIKKEMMVLTPIIPVIQKLQEGNKLTKEDRKILKNFNTALKKIYREKDPKNLANYEINFIDGFLGTENHVMSNGSNEILNDNIVSDLYTGEKADVSIDTYNSELASEGDARSEDLSSFDDSSFSDDSGELLDSQAIDAEDDEAKNISIDSPSPGDLGLPPPPNFAKKSDSNTVATQDHNRGGLLESIRSHGGVKNLKKTESDESKSPDHLRTSSSSSSSLLDEIQKGTKLKTVHQDNERKSVVNSSDDLASQLQEAMGKRRKDIAPPEEDYDDDDNDAWDD